MTAAHHVTPCTGTGTAVSLQRGFGGFFDPL